MRGGRAIPAAVLSLALTGAVSAFEVKIRLTEPAGVERDFEVVTAGIPLPEGKVRDVSILRMLNDKGREIYADFRPLAFYTWGERSVRWVQVTFILGRLEPHGSAVYHMRDDGPPSAKEPGRYHWHIMTPSAGVIVETRGARFEVGRQFLLFTRASVDVNGNRKFEKSERLIDRSLNHGGVARDNASLAYNTSFQVQELDVVQRSPLHCVVRATGTHGNPDGGGFARGLYDYEVYLTFHYARPWVWVDYILKNAPKDPRGAPVMQDYWVVTRLDLGGGVTGRILADRVHTVNLPQGDAALLYQDSDGSEVWDKPPAKPIQTAWTGRFRGFQLMKGPLRSLAVTDSGLKARGFVDLSDGRWGMMAGLIDFWQTYPKAVELDGGGRVVFHLFPARAAGKHWIDDQGHVGHRLVYGLYPKRRGATQWTLESFAAESANPVVPQVSAAYAQKCGALHDLGPYVVTDRTTPLGAADLAGRAKERVQKREYGWEVYGSSWAERTGPPTGAYDPMRSTDALFRYVATGDQSWFDLGLLRARHMRDIRTYHVDGVDVFAAWRDLEHARTVLPVGSRTRPFTVGPGLRAYTAGKQPRTRWPLPGEANLSIDELYNFYLLTGDLKTLSSIREAVAAARAYLVAVPDKHLRPGRENALCLRALVKYHELVGHDDPRALEDIRRLAARLKAVLDPARAAIRADGAGGFVPPADTGLFLRAVAMAYRVMEDKDGGKDIADDLLDLAIGAGDWLTEFAVTGSGFGDIHTPGNELKDRADRVNAGDDPGDPFRGLNTATCLEPLAWLYVQTGDGRYLAAAKSVEPFIGAAARRAAAGFLTYYYRVVTDVDRIDTVPPAAVTDLKAVADAGTVTLTWTAPGDNGREGRAARYRMKYAKRSIVDVPTLTKDGAAEASWWSAANAVGEPAPAQAQTAQSMKVTGLNPGTYYFALKARDEAPNVGPLSNVVMLKVP